MKLQNSVKTIASLLEKTTPCDVHIQGWVKEVQRFGRFLFVHLVDGMCTKHIQTVVPRSICAGMNIGSAVDIRGAWIRSSGTKQAMELQASEFTVVANNSLDIRHDVTLDALRHSYALRTKSRPFTSLLRLRSALNNICHQFFQENFIHVDTPSLSVNDCEGAGQVFSVHANNHEKFFGEATVYLTVSAQLHLEAISSSIPKVYTIGTTYRSEVGGSRRHLAEFRMLEAEFAFAKDVDQLCEQIERLIRFVVRSFQQSKSLSEFDYVTTAFQIVPFYLLRKSNDKSSTLVCSTISDSREFPRLRFDDAIEVLRRKGGSVGARLSRRNEIDLIDYCKSPLFVTHFPSEPSPFYMRRSTDEKYVLNCDFLAPKVGELVGGSLREQSAEVMRKRGCGRTLDWYLELRNAGHPPTAGFGVGMERFMQTLFGIENIKDTNWFRVEKVWRLMVRLKTRYVVIEIVSEDENVKNFTTNNIYSSLCEQISDLFGDYGLAAAKTALSVKIYDAVAKTFVVRVGFVSRNFLLGAIPFVFRINKIPVVLRSIFLGGTIRSCQKALLRSSKKKLYECLKVADNEGDRQFILQSLKKITIDSNA